MKIKIIVQFKIYIFLISLIVSSFPGILYPVEFTFGEERTFQYTSILPENDYYIKTRIPILFNYWNERNFMYEEFHARYEKANEDLDMPDSSEYFHKDKCKITKFFPMREIALSLNKSTLLKWDLCYNLELDKKRLLLDGKESTIQTLEKERIENWKKYLEEEIDKNSELPIPELIPKLIPNELQLDAKTYYRYLLIYLYNGVYSGLVIEEITRRISDPFDVTYKKYIMNFNKYLYDEKISIEEKKSFVQSEIQYLKRDIFLYQFKMMRVSVLRLFPAKTQKVENTLVLNKIKKAVERLTPHLDKFNKEKDKLNRTVECLENWPSWHKENLRMAYYYNFFYDYGNPKKYSIELLKDPEYGKIAESLDERKYKSQIFQNRLELMMNDACSTAEKTEEFIKLTFKPI